MTVMEALHRLSLSLFLVLLAGTASGCWFDITIYNDSVSESVCFVRISETTDDSWGDDELGGTETIAPGDSRSFTEFIGDYDLRVEGCQGTVTENLGVELYDDVFFSWEGL